MNAVNPAELKVDDLKAEIDKRNEGRADEDKIPADGNKADLIAAIELDDERAARVAELQGPSAPETAEPEAVEEPVTEVVQDTVTLRHPTDSSLEVEVLKPSADYTNFVRGYGYTEVDA